MLKGQVFSRQLFESQIFALFINTFLNGENGVSSNYKNAMQPTYSGSNVTINSGAVCIQGRFLEEDTGYTVNAGTNPAYCKLVIEINLDEQNTESEFNQGSYKIITGSSTYPTLTQTDIVKNNSGIYQYELARFRTTASGITDFQDMRTYLDFNSIYTYIRNNYKALLEELEQELENVKNGSDVLLKTGGTATGDFVFEGNVSSNNFKNKNGSNAIYHDEFAVITGQITTPAEGDSNVTGEVKLNYPDGFTFENCTIISLMGLNSAKNTWTTAMGRSSSSILFGTSELCASLKQDTISIRKYKTSTAEPSSTITVRAVLMKM